MFGKIPIGEKCIPVLREKIDELSNPELKEEFESAWIEYRDLPKIDVTLRIFHRSSERY